MSKYPNLAYLQEPTNGVGLMPPPVAYRPSPVGLGQPPPAALPPAPVEPTKPFPWKSALLLAAAAAGVGYLVWDDQRTDEPQEDEGDDEGDDEGEGEESETESETEEK